MTVFCNTGYFKKRELKKFYKRQNEIVEGWKSDEKLLSLEGGKSNLRNDTEKVWDTRISTVTVILNVLLIGAKIFAAIESRSLSILASVVDSLMDVVAGLIVWYTCKKIENTNKNHYPVGLNKLEPLTVVLVGMLMIFANMVVVQESATETILGKLCPRVDLSILIILCTGTSIKFVLFLICRVRRSAACLVLAIDQRNDCMTNLVALAGAFIGHRWWVYADPIGAFLVSGFIIVTWAGTIKEHVPFLIGRSADPEFIHRVTNVSINHDERIRSLDMVYVYHFGANFLVEVHVVLDARTTLKDAHDISELLQCKIERLPYVERAFVHCDYQHDGDEHL
ncbi:unnamed protein product [Caenorhabditis auriculariae]|uniref:Cation efflux protein cytoplasmic domain-containing protein n=1 Tax=Caenorhabditis auriculariae TaxID=2777116 RepID=A0A8S1H1Y3_9PELO|nr:unnamed protein product [Caenorhabditis auriculariae]